MVSRLINERPTVTSEIIERAEAMMVAARQAAKRLTQEGVRAPVSWGIQIASPTALPTVRIILEPKKLVRPVLEPPRPTIQLGKDCLVQVVAEAIVRPDGNSVIAKRVRFEKQGSCGIERRVLDFEPPIKVDPAGVYTSSMVRKGRDRIREWVPFNAGLAFGDRKILGKIGAAPVHNR